MAHHVLRAEAAYVEVRGKTVASAATLDRATTAFGLSAAIARVFNTLLAWIKDAYEPLNTFMASLTGHHWTTHGIADVLLFVALGFILMNTRIPERVSASAVITTLASCVVASGIGLIAWFVLF